MKLKGILGDWCPVLVLFLVVTIAKRVGDCLININTFYKQ